MGTQLPGLKHDPFDRPASGIVTKPTLQGIDVGSGNSLSYDFALSVDCAHMS
jgi:hypothetical protein